MFSVTSAEVITCLPICIVFVCLSIHPDVINANGALKSKMLLLFVFAIIMCGTVLTKDIILFFVGIELLGIISSIFVSIEKHTQPASCVYNYNMFASLLFLYGILNKNTEFGSWCLLTSCLCKGAQIPFSRWLLQAVHAHTFVSIFIHCVTIIGIAPICFYKFDYLFVSYHNLLTFTTILGLISAITFSVMPLFETDIKRIMAMLTISSAGIMITVCGLKYPNLGTLYFICHAFFKSIIFLMFYYYIGYYKSRDIRKFKCNHNTKILGFLALLSSLGVPPFIASYAKLAISNIDMPIYCKIGIILSTLFSDTVFIRLYLTCFKNKSIGQKFKLHPVWILSIISLPIGYIAFTILHGTIALYAIIEELLIIISSYLIAKKLPIKQINIKIPKLSFQWLINLVYFFNKFIEHAYITIVYTNPYKIGNSIAILHKNSFRAHAIWIFCGFVFLALYALIYCND